MDHTDEFIACIQRAAAGSREAFAEIYDRTIDDVWQTVHFLVKEQANRDDVVQDIYLQLFKSLPRFQSEKPFRPWLMGLVMRQVSAYRTKRWRLFQLISRESRQAAKVQYDFAHDLIEKLDNQQLLSAIGSLPFRCKQVVVLRYLHEYSQEEIAEILEIPLGTVKSRLNAALKRLRRKLQTPAYYQEKESNLHGH